MQLGVTTVREAAHRVVLGVEDEARHGIRLGDLGEGGRPGVVDRGSHVTSVAFAVRIAADQQDGVHRGGAERAHHRPHLGSPEHLAGDVQQRREGGGLLGIGIAEPVGGGVGVQAPRLPPVGAGDPSFCPLYTSPSPRDRTTTRIPSFS